MTAIELVTADGGCIASTATSEPDLFWALRGGGGNFGVVTAIEFRLFPIEQVYAGILWFPVERAAEVLARVARVDGRVAGRDDVGRPHPAAPAARRRSPSRCAASRSSSSRSIHAGDAVEGDELVAPLRALGPVMDTVEPIPMPALSHLHMDPEHPVPGSGDGMMLDDVDAETIDAFVVRTAVGSPLLSVEMRQLGGEIGRSRARARRARLVRGAVPDVRGRNRADRRKRCSGQSTRSRRFAALAPWEAEHTYLNFAETRRQGEHALERDELSPAPPHQGGRSTRRT